ncbi:BON domain-containing protein [Alphaproteobacteria bacterium]|nr:BON domain-containing protein [Alphaproteobacteria bacterium]
MKKIYLISLFLFVFQSCAPIVGTVGMFSLGAASKEKGIGTALNDTIIKTKISNLIFKKDPSLIADTKITVNNGSVLFTGKVSKPETRIQFTKIAWSVKGVNEVNNEIQISNTSSLRNIARDISSMGEIRARIMTDKKINSINFSIDVVNDIAYLSGVASNIEEMGLVKAHASSARFIKEVYNYITLTDDTR